MNPLSLFIAWRQRRASERAIRAAEKRRSAIISQQQYRKAKHRAWRYLDSDLMQATHASLRASVGRR
jgi:hypothetical protein